MVSGGFSILPGIGLCNNLELHHIQTPPGLLLFNCQAYSSDTPEVAREIGVVHPGTAPRHAILGRYVDVFKIVGSWMS